MLLNVHLVWKPYIALRATEEDNSVTGNACFNFTDFRSKSRLLLESRRVGLHLLLDLQNRLEISLIFQLIRLRVQIYIRRNTKHRIRAYKTAVILQRNVPKYVWYIQNVVLRVLYFLLLFLLHLLRLPLDQMLQRVRQTCGLQFLKVLSSLSLLQLDIRFLEQKQTNVITPFSVLYEGMCVKANTRT